MSYFSFFSYSYLTTHSIIFCAIFCVPYNTVFLHFENWNMFSKYSKEMNIFFLNNLNCQRSMSLVGMNMMMWVLRVAWSYLWVSTELSPCFLNFVQKGLIGPDLAMNSWFPIRKINKKSDKKFFPFPLILKFIELFLTTWLLRVKRLKARIFCFH